MGGHAQDVAYANRAKAGTDKSMKLPGRHWQEKKLSEMTDRDWRIFREDFNISYKSLRDGVKPLRSWAEAALPPQLLQVSFDFFLRRRRRQQQQRRRREAVLRQ